MRSLVLTLTLIWSGFALAQGGKTALARPALLPQDVRAASEAHFPTILQALAKRQVAEGKVTEALGAFDVVFAADGFDRVDGFYDGTALGWACMRN